MPHALHPVLATTFQAEARDVWPREGHADPDQALVMHSIGDLVENGPAGWDYSLSLFGEAVVHLRETEIERTI
jgi:hypothetical protein